MTIDDVGGWPELLAKLTRGQDLTGVEAQSAMAAILDGTATQPQIAAYIVALRVKGETVEELRGMVDAMLAAAEPLELGVDGPVIDVVGTGGDGARTINVSTMAALVATGAGARVCKHGNRAASSATGTADVLEALGVTIDGGPDHVARSVGEAGIGFCFAPRFHPAMRHAGPVRREMGIPTAFNILGPLANPARVRRMMIGVADAAMAERMVGVLAARNCEHAMVVHGDDGLDELSISSTSSVIELRDGKVDAYRLDPADLGIDRAPLSAVQGGDAATNAEVARRVLTGELGPRRDIVCLNAAAAIVVAGLAEDLAGGLELARDAIDQGSAAAVLERFTAVSSG